MTPTDYDRLIKLQNALITQHTQIRDQLVKEKKNLLKKHAALKKKRDEKFAIEETSRILDKITSR